MESQSYLVPGGLEFVLGTRSTYLTYAHANSLDL